MEECFCFIQFNVGALQKKLNYKSDFSFSVHLNMKEEGEE